MIRGFRVHIKKVIVVAITFFCSCDNGRKEALVQDPLNQEPLAIAYDIRMVYTDSLKVKAILTAPVHHDYTNLSLQYSEFPEGVKVVFLDENNQENTVVADRGILYNATSIIDLQGNVLLEASDGSLLKTPQLYWDADAEWIFTEKAFTFSNQDYDVAATRLDTNKEFTKFSTGKLTGTVAVQEENSQEWKPAASPKYFISSLP